MLLKLWQTLCLNVCAHHFGGTSAGALRTSLFILHNMWLCLFNMYTNTYRERQRLDLIESLHYFTKNIFSSFPPKWIFISLYWGAGGLPQLSCLLLLFCLLHLPSLTWPLCEVRGRNEVIEGRCFLPSFEEACKDQERNYHYRGIRLLRHRGWAFLRGNPQSHAADIELILATVLEMVAHCSTLCCSCKP